MHASRTPFLLKNIHHFQNVQLLCLHEIHTFGMKPICHNFYNLKWQHFAILPYIIFSHRILSRIIFTQNLFHYLHTLFDIYFSHFMNIYSHFTFLHNVDFPRKHSKFRGCAFFMIYFHKSITMHYRYESLHTKWYSL